MDSALIAALLLYASVTSGLPIPPAARPVVGIATAIDGDKLAPHGPYGGLTSRRDGRIGLYAMWRPDADGLCLLVHELVHFLQFANGRLGDSSQNEPPAYRAEADCYERQGMKEKAARQRSDAERYERLAQ